MKKVVSNYLLIAVLAVAAVFTSCDKNNGKLNDFTVFFNCHCNDGNNIQSQRVKEGEKIIKPINPIRCGYKFVAWFKEVELTNEWEFDIDVVISDMTLFAKWSECTEDCIYPTTFLRLSEETLLQMRNEFSQKNPYVYTSLNQFGFCAMLSAGGGDGTPGGFTKEEAIAAVKEFVAHNPEYTGVRNPDDLQFRMISSFIGFNDAVFWSFRTENQTINGIKVEYTEILFHTQNRKLVSCYGNHFPNVYVPDKFNFDIEQAKFQLLGKEIFHWGWGGGQYSAGIVTTEHLQQSTAKLMIVPITTDEKIELRVAWQINLKAPLYYIIEIDIMTGEIIREMPTIIS